MGGLVKEKFSSLQTCHFYCHLYLISKPRGSFSSHKNVSATGHLHNQVKLLPADHCLQTFKAKIVCTQYTRCETIACFTEKFYMCQKILAKKCYFFFFLKVPANKFHVYLNVFPRKCHICLKVTANKSHICLKVMAKKCHICLKVIAKKYTQYYDH